VAALSAVEPPRCLDGLPLRVGDRVVWSVAASCGRCATCRRGLEQKCQYLRKYGHEALADDWRLSGGFATHCVLQPGTAVVRVPESVPDEAVVSASCATATVAAVLSAAGDPAGTELLVTGAGMLGVTASAMAAQAGAAVTVCDPDPWRRELARRFGAARTLAPDEPTGRADIALELSGSPSAVGTCLAAVGLGGRVVLAGSVSASDPVPMDPQRLVRNLITVTGVHNYRPRDLAAGVAFLTRHHGTYPFAELVGGWFGLGQLDAALAAAAAGPAPRQAVRPAAEALPPRAAGEPPRPGGRRPGGRRP
jgi:putative phosphonate catabolism associated alcohol dehydrogenase